jgi:hypothetical protein
LPLREGHTTYRGRRFAGAILVSDQESWIGVGRHGSTAVMTEWQEFVKNQVRLHGRDYAGPKLVCLDLQPYTTTQAPASVSFFGITAVWGSGWNRDGFLGNCSFLTGFFPDKHSGNRPPFGYNTHARFDLTKIIQLLTIFVRNFLRPFAKFLV